MVLSNIGLANHGDFTNSLNRISNHILGNSTLSGAQITSEQAIIESNVELLVSDYTVMSESLKLVSLFETEIGPLFVTGPTSISRKASAGYELELFMMYLQQSILDKSYNKSNLSKALFKRTFDRTIPT